MIRENSFRSWLWRFQSSRLGTRIKSRLTCLRNRFHKSNLLTESRTTWYQPLCHQFPPSNSALSVYILFTAASHQPRSQGCTRTAQFHSLLGIPPDFLSMNFYFLKSSTSIQLQSLTALRTWLSPSRIYSYAIHRNVLVRMANSMSSAWLGSR